MLIILIRIVLIIITYVLIFIMGYLGILTYQSNLTGWFLILTALTYGLGGLFLFRTHFKNESIVRKEKRDLSFWMVVPGFLVVFYASPLEYLLFPEIHQPILWMQILGLVMIVISMFLFGWARIVLGGMYSGHLQVKTDHILVQHGPYRTIRHPAYAAYIIMGFGIAIGYSSLIGFLSIPLLLFPALIYRIFVEEKILSAEFGEQYKQYSHGTRRLIPGIW
jgi:protein-S-isoprenylcysteine O-methyltransferase Ste14